MSKWSELTGGDSLRKSVERGSKTNQLKTVEVLETTASEGFGSWSIAIWIVAAVFLVAIIALTKSSGTTLPRNSLPAHELNVIQTTIGEDLTIKDTPSDPTEYDAVVQPRKSLGLWNTVEDVGTEPFLGHDSGFQEYQQAFQQGRSSVVQEKSKKAFSHSTEGLQDFLQSGHAVPDSLLESLGSEAPVARRTENRIMDDETMMLAREALQTVRGTPEAVASILKDILGARTEAADKGIELPDMPEEQRSAVQHWSRQSGPAGLLAKQILSRAH